MQNIVKLNLARNCIKYIIKAYGIKEIFVPYYTCSVVWNAIRSLKCKVKFYHIGKDFLPLNDFSPEAYILYTNYFGICSDNCKLLSKKYKNLIIDNSQSFYSEPLGLVSFNSLRKFFNVQNGAYLYTSKIINENFATDKLNLTPVLMQRDYEKLLYNELFLNNETEIKLISPKVEREMQQIDFEKDKSIRIELFKKYSKIFNFENKITITHNIEDIPYCYPFCPKDLEFLEPLTQNNFPILRLWEDINKKFPEYKFLNNTIALPLNDKEFAEKILKVFTQK